MENDAVPPAPSHAPADDLTARRSLLATAGNPESRLDYLVTLTAVLDAGPTPTDITLRYVPDRLVLMDRAWTDYIRALQAAAPAGPETLAATVLSDTANQVVPRWLEVRIDRRDASARSRHGVVMQEAQPQWSDGALAALLRVE